MQYLDLFMLSNNRLLSWVSTLPFCSRNGSENGKKYESIILKKISVLLFPAGKSMNFFPVGKSMIFFPVNLQENDWENVYEPIRVENLYCLINKS